MPPKQAKQKPIITHTKQVAKTRIFEVEELDLEFSNGEKRTFERLVAGANGAVMIVAILDNEFLLLIREYSAGTHDYQLAFPKGLMESGETVEQAANRELMEEVGFGANKFTVMKQMTLAPGYLTHRMNLLFAESLYEEKRQGDEPEELEVVKWRLDELDKLIEQPDFTEARSVAALFLAQKIIQSKIK
ncbi:MAG: ADP compounds hydrolase NudE [Enterobacterales bacterium]|nr:ADP compounds hydrolase NudE [Enterobacterales bacterium]